MFNAKLFEEVDFEGMKVEAIGVFAVVYFGGWAYEHHARQMEDMLAVATVHLLVYSLFVWTSFKISGGLFNPSLTLVLMVFGRLKAMTGLFYIISQILGSLMAASLLKMINKQKPEYIRLGIDTKSDICGYPSTTHINISGIYEIIGTFMVVFVYYIVGVAKLQKYRHIQGITIGSGYFTANLIYGKIGGSANIARMFGPLVLANQWIFLLVASLGSIIGAFSAALLSEKVILFDAKLESIETTKVAGLELTAPEIEEKEPEREYRPTDLLQFNAHAAAYDDDHDDNFHL